ncbi:hypothetical protein HK100_008234 [Physocladia obscura]|uniref:RNI-like protein n=1 Tax=Physocladia obscura TaxID=109957 RepID=A0AAD5X7V4_9FUNG|nr:hypothetical protein HK100_008234 [Physocladia obscura]
MGEEIENQTVTTTTTTVPIDSDTVVETGDELAKVTAGLAGAGLGGEEDVISGDSDGLGAGAGVGGGLGAVAEEEEGEEDEDEGSRTGRAGNGNGSGNGGALYRRRESESMSPSGVSGAYSAARAAPSSHSFSYRPLSPSSASASSRRSSMLPAARTREDGPPVPIAAITGAVRLTNPILDEILHSIRLLADNDPALQVLDLKDCSILSLDLQAALADALPSNTHLKVLNLCNCQIATVTAQELAYALRSNTSIEYLNLESNAIAPQGIKHLAEALAFNSSLLELRLIHQKQPAGIDAEQTFAKALQKNESLIKLGLQFRDAASRNDVDRIIMRNKDLTRKRRLAAALAAQQ